MKFLYALGLFAASVSAGAFKTYQRPLFGRYELSLTAASDGVPFYGGALSLSGANAGFYGIETEPLVVDVREGASEVRLSIPSSEGHLALEGHSGLRGLVLVAEASGDEPSGGAGDGFVLEQRGGEEEERLFNVTLGGGEGQWFVESVGGDDYELKWWDGEGFTISTVFPVQLVGRLTARS